MKTILALITLFSIASAFASDTQTLSLRCEHKGTLVFVKASDRFENDYHQTRRLLGSITTVTDGVGVTQEWPYHKFNKLSVKDKNNFVIEGETFIETNGYSESAWQSYKVARVGGNSIMFGRIDFNTNDSRDPRITVTFPANTCSINITN